MKLEISPTNVWTRINGTLVRVWRAYFPGEMQGIKVFVAGAVPEGDPAQVSELPRELRDIPTLDSVMPMWMVAGSYPGTWGAGSETEPDLATCGQCGGRKFACFKCGRVAGRSTDDCHS